MSDKHLFTDGVDTVAGADEQEADMVWSNYTGDPEHNPDGDCPWRMVPDDQMVEIYFEAELKPEYLPVGVVTTFPGEDNPFPNRWAVCYIAPAAAWATSGLAARYHILCSTEY